jgi:hypothetical protein
MLLLLIHYHCCFIEILVTSHCYDNKNKNITVHDTRQLTANNGKKKKGMRMFIYSIKKSDDHFLEYSAN